MHDLSIQLGPIKREKKKKTTETKMKVLTIYSEDAGFRTVGFSEKEKWRSEKMQCIAV